jgi:hypothetical protein
MNTPDQPQTMNTPNQPQTMKPTPAEQTRADRASMNTQTTEPQTMNTPTLAETAAALGFTIEAGTPTPHNADGWIAIEYPVTLSRHGKPVISTTYKMGIGHFEKQTLSHIAKTFRPVENTIRKNGFSVIRRLQPKDQNTALEIITAAARNYKMQPELANVVAALLMDGSPDFDAETFENWAVNYGYDTDSRTAEKTYSECVRTGQAIRRAVSADELKTLRSAAAEH